MTSLEKNLPQAEEMCAENGFSSALLYQLLAAEFAGQRGQYELSVQHYLEMAQANCDIGIAIRLANIGLFVKDYAAAAAGAKIWLQHQSDSAEAYQILAIYALEQQNIEQALTHLQAMLDYAHDGFDQKLWVIANFLSQKGNKELLADLMGRLIAIYQDNQEILFVCAQIFSTIGNFDGAEEILGQLLIDNPDSKQIIFAYLNLIQVKAGNDKAIIWLKDRILKQSSDPDLKKIYGRLLINSERFDEALKIYHELLNESPDNAEILYSIGLIYLNFNRYKEAEQYFLKLNKTHQYAYDASYYLGLIAENKKDFAKAHAWYIEVQGGANHLDAQIRLSGLYAQQGHIEEGLRYIRNIQSDRPYAKTLLTQAEASILVDSGRLEEAVLVFDTALANEPMNLDLLYSRAILAEKMSRLDIFERDLRKIIELNPKHAEALNALGYILADKTDRYEEAYSLIAQAMELKPNDFHILDSMGWVLYRLGNCDEAVRYLRTALDLRYDLEISAHLSEVLWEKGERESAQEILEGALKKAPNDMRLLNLWDFMKP